MRHGFKMENYSFILKNESKTDYFASNDNISYPGTIVIINCVLNAPLMLTAITGNSLVLGAILRTPSLRSPSTVFLCSLAFSDFLVGLVVQPVSIVYRLKSSHTLLYTNNILSALVCAVSLCTMATISIDRLLALHCHMRYPDLMTTKRATYISASIWFICAVLSCIYFLSETVYFLGLAVGVVICLLILSFCYVRIYRIVRHHQLQIQAQQQAVESVRSEHNLNMLRSRKSAMNTFIFYICMILCYTPVVISLFVFAVFHKDGITFRVLAYALVYLNSSINPFLYCWRLSEIRVAVVKTLRKMLCKQTD